MAPNLSHVTTLPSSFYYPIWQTEKLRPGTEKTTSEGLKVSPQGKVSFQGLVPKKLWETTFLSPHSPVGSPS